MQFMVFTDKLSDGVASIDHQHARLVDIINQLYALVLKHDTAASLETVFDDLARYTEQHFEYEEKLFAANGYPKLEEHRAHHDDFRRRLADYRDRIGGRNDTILAADLLHVLKQWLTDHIATDDKEACRHLNACGIH
ncbi:bacteriohemerythrin [Rhizomicrobium electricum]|jgi:hemerythrin-like metal-binding protein|uniref:Bacteriohemerythrin n=1 Tax=Rhizomicrobium electricum TaxID=480070 RepID=A0ABP3PA71_9PROT|nr:bacteriohemerythrin [Rhizomicrobium electricum]NIJ48203.1 hemerythrin-like metal-binding protein [Rhizomicrobium electricum]